MTIGLIAVMFSSAALVILAAISFFYIQNQRVQIWYIFLASFFSGVLFIVGLNSAAYSIMLWPMFIVLHVISKISQLSRQLFS
jgi:hypothetical protein